MIDRHNRCRQDDLMLERKVGTHHWSFRVNCSLLGVIVVDAWLLYSGGRGSRASLEQRSFYEKLADQLIDNTYDFVSLRDRSTPEIPSCNVTPRRRDAHLTPTKRRRMFNGQLQAARAQGKCYICKVRKTTRICSIYIDKDPEKGSVWLATPKVVGIAFFDTFTSPMTSRFCLCAAIKRLCVFSSSVFMT
jgi:hypothetical protein